MMEEYYNLSENIDWTPKKKKIDTFTCLTKGMGTINSPTSISPIDLERHKPPGQQRRGPICKGCADLSTIVG